MRTSAPESTNKAAIAIGAGLANTAKASAGVTKPSRITAATPAVATTTGGNRSVTKPANSNASNASPISALAAVTLDPPAIRYAA